MPTVYKNEAGVYGISPQHQIPDPLELLTILTVMAVSGALASIRKDFIILTILTVQSVLIEENNIETTKEGKNVGEEKDKMEGMIDDKWNLKFLVIIYISMKCK